MVYQNKKPILASVMGDVKLHFSAGLFGFGARLLGLSCQTLVLHFRRNPRFFMELLDRP